MSSARFYCVCGLLPLAVPVPLGLALFTTSMAVADPIAGPLLSLSELVLGSPLVGGLPYVLFAGPVLWWARGRDARFQRRLAWAAPLFFAVWLLFLVLVAVLIRSWVQRSGVGWSDVRLAGSLALLAVGFGYPYVLIARMLEAFAQRRGWVEPDERCPTSECS